MIRVSSAAKVNLTLDILSRRPDGYHELASIVHTIGLWDHLIIEPGAEDTFACNEPGVPQSDNLCTKAAQRWIEAAHAQCIELDFTKVRITLEKNIPVGAGLGGGSGNAAAVLLALNEYQRRRVAPLLERTVLHEIGVKLGADVPLFLDGGCLLMEGIGEKLSSLPELEGWLVILKPDIHGDTGRVYAAWDAQPIPPVHASETMSAILRNEQEELKLGLVAKYLHNDLSEPARQCGIPIREILAALQPGTPDGENEVSNKPLGAAMSGSGSACFAVYSKQETAEAALKHLETQAGATDSFRAVVPFCSSGVRIEQS
jgi:4-diphosphocytidyl-2-C-methyl-D-erythritol kinase